LSTEAGGQRSIRTWSFFRLNSVRKPLIILFLCALATIALAAPPSGCVDLSSIPERTDVEWTEVHNRLGQEAGCTQNCHLGSSAAGNLDLSNRRLSQLFLVEQYSSQDFNTFLVRSGFPEHSLLFNKLNCSMPGIGGRMPPGGSVSLSLQALIFDWIESGARGESPEDPIQRDFVFRAGFDAGRRSIRP
jgi:hypothetical protein